MTILILSFTVIILVSIFSLVFAIYKMLETIKEMAKIIKAENLIEYESEKNINEEKNEDDGRYADIWSLSDEELKEVKIDFIK